MVRPCLSEETLNRACRCLKGMAHPTRLAILRELKDGPLSVGEIERRLGSVRQSNLSQHLIKMQDCGLLTSQREGVQMFYAVTDERVFSFLDLMSRLFCRK